MDALLERRRIGAALCCTICTCLCGVAAGVAMMAWGRALPGTLDPARAEVAFQAWCGPDGVDRVRGGEYLSLLTARYPLIDAGTALVAGCVAVMALLSGLFLTADRGKPWLRTPRRRSSFLAIGLGVIALHFTAEIVSLELELQRMMFPWCADSIAIPMVGIALLASIVSPILIVIGTVITLAFGGLPVALTRWDAGRRARSWISTILCCFGLLLMGAGTVFSAPSGLWIHIPGDVAAFYLMFATRAAILAPPRT